MSLRARLLRLQNLALDCLFFFAVAVALVLMEIWSNLGTFWNWFWSRWWTQFLRPLGHLVAYYPLLLPIPLLLFTVCWNILLREYDGFHVLWSPTPIAGILSGMGVALLLGATLLAVFLLNQARETPPAALNAAPPTAANGLPPLGPLPFWFLWVVLLVAIAFPAIVPHWFFNDGPAPFRVNNAAINQEDVPDFAAATTALPTEDAAAFQVAHDRMKGARLWFPIGLAITGGFFVVTRLLFARVFWTNAEQLRHFALWLFIVFSSHYGLMFLAHGFLGNRTVGDKWEDAWSVRIVIGFSALLVGGFAGWLILFQKKSTPIGARVAAGLVTALVLWSAAWVGLTGTAYCSATGAPVAILGAFGVLGGLAALISSWNYPRRSWVIFATLGPLTLPFLFSDLQTEYRVPGLDELKPEARREGTDSRGYYERDRLVTLEKYNDLRPNVSDPEDKDGLIRDVTVLGKTRDRIGPNRPVIVVAVSGGASASAVYTADILYTLEMQYPGFVDQVRVVTGASGGMLGGAYFVAEFRTGAPLANARDEHRAGRMTTEEYVKRVAEARRQALDDLARDFLGPLVQRWVYRDIPLYLIPRGTTNDRGLALEQGWRSMKGLDKNASDGVLHVPLKDLREDERQGKIPSLIFTPMMIEDGRQLLISNLDLDYMVDSTLPIFDAPREKAKNPQVSHTALEFFRLFRDAGNFRVSTAVRLQASFPFLSPPAALPTWPRRHVVDAGYFDNYGTLAATKWIYRNAQPVNEGLPFISDAPAGSAQIVMLQIHCFAFERETKDWVRRKEKGKEEGRPAALYSLFAPFVGALESRKANMVYRGDERVAAVKQLLKTYPNQPLPEFERVLIECQIEPSLNWALTPDDLRLLRRDVWSQLEAPEKDRAIKGLGPLFQNGTRPPSP